jgi:glycerol-3-phosphate acyltransferase PlsX
MRVALDAMGGDDAPRITVEGALAAAAEGLDILLVGDEAVLDEELKTRGGLVPNLRVRHAAQVVEMDDAPGASFRRKKDSSLRVAFELVRNKQADAVVTMGNSGAALAAGMFVCRRLDGVIRPAITALVPGDERTVVLLDVGANTECRPDHLFQFGLMGAALASAAFGTARPAVAVLSNGAEADKGTDLTRAAARMLGERSDIDFRGYIEPGELLRSSVDVVVTDGWTGNMVLKTAEGVLGHTKGLLREAAQDGPAARFGAVLMRRALGRTLGRLKQGEAGGGLLLGIDACAVIGHGGADAEAVTAALRFASRLAEAKLPERIRETLRGSIGELIGVADTGPGQ